MDSETFSWLSAYNNALMGRRRVSGGISWDKCKVGFITERPQRGRESCRLSESRLFWEQWGLVYIFSINWLADRKQRGQSGGSTLSRLNRGIQEDDSQKPGESGCGVSDRLPVWCVESPPPSLIRFLWRRWVLSNHRLPGPKQRKVSHSSSWERRTSPLFWKEEDWPVGLREHRIGGRQKQNLGF